MTISCNEINIRHPQGTEGGDAQLELVKTEVWGANYAFLRQKMANFGTSSGAVLCHGCCHTGTELSCDSLKLSECVQNLFFEVLQALDRAKRIAGSRDMIFSTKTR